MLDDSLLAIPGIVVFGLLQSSLLFEQNLLIHLLHAHHQLLSLLQDALVSFSALAVHSLNEHRALEVGVSFTVDSSRSFSYYRLAVDVERQSSVVNHVGLAVLWVHTFSFRSFLGLEAALLSALHARFLEIRLWSRSEHDDRPLDLDIQLNVWLFVLRDSDCLFGGCKLLSF